VQILCAILASVHSPNPTAVPAQRHPSIIDVPFRMLSMRLCLLVRCRLLDVVGDNTPLQDAFLLADDVLRQVSTPIFRQPLPPGTSAPR